MRITQDADFQRILSKSQVIAVVGHSDNPIRTSYRIAQYLRSVGYTVYPVNPTVSQIDGKPSYATLADVPEPIDLVNVFRRSEFLDEVVDATINVGAKVVWSQLGVVDEEAALKAVTAGLDMVMNRCIKVEHQRVMAAR